MVALHEAKMDLTFQSIGPQLAKEHSNTERNQNLERIGREIRIHC
jgi:hypothetical protein